MVGLQRGYGNAAVARMLQRAPALTDDPAAQQSPPVHRASADNLRPLIENRVETWKRAAETGVENFADAELLHEIEDATSFNVAAFLTALIGNVVWAAACFAPVGLAGTAFAISMGSISLASIGAAPGSKPASQLMQVKTAMQQQLDRLNNTLRRQVPSVTDGILSTHPGVDVEEALEVFMTSNFEPQFLQTGGTDRRTELAEGAVREIYQHLVADPGLEHPAAADLASDRSLDAEPALEREGPRAMFVKACYVIAGLAAVGEAPPFCVHCRVRAVTGAGVDRREGARAGWPACRCH